MKQPSTNLLPAHRISVVLSLRAASSTPSAQGPLDQGQSSRQQHLSFGGRGRAGPTPLTPRTPWITQASTTPLRAMVSLLSSISFANTPPTTLVSSYESSSPPHGPTSPPAASQEPAIADFSDGQYLWTGWPRVRHRHQQRSNSFGIIDSRRMADYRLAGVICATLQTSVGHVWLLCCSPCRFYYLKWRGRHKSLFLAGGRLWDATYIIGMYRYLCMHLWLF